MKERAGIEGMERRVQRVVRVESWAMRVSRSVELVTGSMIVAQRSSWGGVEEVLGDSMDIEELGVRDTPPSSGSGSSVLRAEAAASCCWNSWCWNSWRVRHCWKRSRDCSRSGRGSVASGVSDSCSAST